MPPSRTPVLRHREATPTTSHKRGSTTAKAVKECEGEYNVLKVAEGRARPTQGT